MLLQWKTCMRGIITGRIAVKAEIVEVSNYSEWTHRETFLCFSQ